MTSKYLVLAANDPRLANAVQDHLHQVAGGFELVCPLEAVRNRLAAGADGLLLLAAARPADLAAIARLLQEAPPRRGPSILLIIHGKAGFREKDWPGLSETLAGRISWPEEAAVLTQRVREHLEKTGHSEAAEAEPLAEAIRRRLLCGTPSLRRLAEPIAPAASYDVPVLITGETGTGKTYLARLLHDCSPRQQCRFLVVSCGALSANLIESELFGHVKGAFTGAGQTKEGKLAAVGNGSLLLDEIDTLSFEQQANLLRVLETGEYEPVGSNETQVCRARIIAASNLNLEEAVTRGLFRADLLYRLHVPGV